MGLSFTSGQNILLYCGFAAILLSIFFFRNKKTAVSLFFLLAAAACIFSFSALLDPFLNLWDERFHALVAKNLMDHPLKPVLYSDPVVDMSYDRWDRAVIWLHKQPLFLWQSALSFKIFGVNEFTFRLPSIVLGICSVYAIFRTGKLLTNAQTGFYAAIFFITTPYMLELLAGRKELDQNDFSFMSYVCLSIWSFTEYHYSGKKRWLILTGIFSGCAVLCKWLAGLLIYAAWIAYKAFERKWKISGNKDLFVSVVITLLIVLPWQMLILYWYPQEAKAEYAFSASHFTKPIEGHSGIFTYYFSRFGEMYGTLLPFTVVPGFVLLYRNSTNRKLTGSLFAMLGSLYVFFSLAATKMPSFTVIGMPVIMLSAGAVFSYLTEKTEDLLSGRKITGILIAIAFTGIMIARIDTPFLSETHSLSSPENEYGRMLSANKKLFKNLSLPENTVLFNVKGRHYVEAMFYSGLPAYNFYPDSNTVQSLQKSGRKIAVFSTEDSLPDYLKQKEVFKIRKEVKGYD